MVFVNLVMLIQPCGLLIVLLSRAFPKSRRCLFCNWTLKRLMILLIDIVYMRLWRTWALLLHLFISLLGELLILVLLQSWAHPGQLCHFRRFEVLDKVALLHLFFLLYMYRFWKDVYFAGAPLLAFTLARTVFWLSAMLTILLFAAIHWMKFPKFFLNCSMPLLS